MRDICPKHAPREIWNVIMAVLLETTLGDIVIDLFTEERPKSEKQSKFFRGETFYLNKLAL